MADDSIKYSDIIRPDDSIERLIRQLEELNTTFGQAMAGIKGSAEGVSRSLRNVSGATAEGRKELDLAAVAASRLDRAYHELEIAMSETGREIAQVKAATSDANKASVAQMRQLNAMVGSYDKLKLELKEAVTLFRSLSAEERANEGMGKALIDEIVRLKNEVKALDTQLKPHVQQLSEVEKAEQKLAFLMSNQGKRYLELQRQIRSITSARKEQKTDADLLVAAEQKLAQANSSTAEALNLYALQIKEANQRSKLRAQLANSEAGSYNALSAQYRLNVMDLNKMSAEERELTKAGQDLVAETNNLYQRMIKLQEATGNHRLSVGNYAKAWNGLSFSITQVIRELPAATVSLNTFFLGISNNIPLVVDEILRLKAANAAAAANGGKVVSITKTIVKSIFSWQSALVVLLTVLSTSGGKIAEWAASLFGAKAKVMSLTKAIKNINKELESTNASYGENVVKLKHLQDEWKKLKTTAEKTKWIKDNKSEFSSLYIEIDNINDAEKTFVTQTDEVVEGFKARAKAAAANKLAAEKYEEAMIEERKALEKEKQGPKQSFLGAFAMVGMAEGMGAASPEQMLLNDKTNEQVHANEVRRIREKAKALEAEGDQYFRLAEGYDKARNQGRGGGGGGGGQELKDPTEYIANMKVRILKKTEESITKLEQEEYKERAKAAIAKYEVQNAELQKTYDKNLRILYDEKNEYIELTEEQKQAIINANEDIRETIVRNQQLLADELRQIELDWSISELKVVQETLRLRLDAVSQEGQAELELRRKILRKQREIALLENQKLPPSQRQNEADINRSFDKQDKLLAGEYAMKYFDEYQALQEAQFNAVKQNERDITYFKLTQEKDRWQQQIALAKAGGLDWSTAQIEAAEAAVRGIDRELKDWANVAKRMATEGFDVTLFQMMGLDDDAVNAAVEHTNIMIEQIQAIMDAEVKAKEQAVALAQERVDAAQSAVDAEIEARKNGYANSVAVAKAELEMEKRNYRQKEKQLKQAQIAQEAINSVTQASSLLTASANLWASFSPIPVIGPALAIAAMTTMWGSFAYAKIRASQLTSKYGEGGLEFLEGGSHASGNDIDLGVSNSKNRRMKAEGGEALAIINKRNSRKYRKVLPQVIDSFNRGTFEQKYLNAFDTGGQPIFVTSQSNNIDLSRIEADIRAIKDRNNTQIYTLPDGSVIMQKKNVKRIIRQ